MTVSVWVSPAATGEMGGGGKTANKSALIARTLEKIFKDHRVVDLESLCIKFGERVRLPHDR
jgi:exosome complex RNA-binding protein Rrp42 (RNase PH superfamily)